MAKKKLLEDNPLFEKTIETSRPKSRAKTKSINKSTSKHVYEPKDQIDRLWEALEYQYGGGHGANAALDHLIEIVSNGGVEVLEEAIEDYQEGIGEVREYVDDVHKWLKEDLPNDMMRIKSNVVFLRDLLAEFAYEFLPLYVKDFKPSNALTYGITEKESLT